MANRAAPALRAWSESKAPQGERQRPLRVLRQPPRDRRPVVRAVATIRPADSIRPEQCDEHSSWQMAQVLRTRPVGKSHQQVPVVRAEEWGGRRARCIVGRLRIAVAHRRNVASIGSVGCRVALGRALSSRHFLRRAPSISGMGNLPTVPMVSPTLAVGGEGPPRLILVECAR